MTTITQDTLALHGGRPSVHDPDNTAWRWPVFADEEKAAVARVLELPAHKMYGEMADFEKELCACFGCRLPVFANVRADRANINPADIARRITPRAKAIIVTHLRGLPCELEEICAIARRHKISICTRERWRSAITGACPPITIGPRSIRPVLAASTGFIPARRHWPGCACGSSTNKTGTSRVAWSASAPGWRDCRAWLRSPCRPTCGASITSYLAAFEKVWANLKSLTTGVTRSNRLGPPGRREVSSWRRRRGVG